MKNTNTKNTAVTETAVEMTSLDKHVGTLDALFKDVTGNVAMGELKKAAGYLKSIGLLATALSRQCQQEFELELIEELEELTRARAIREALEVKRSLNKRELQLSMLESNLANYFASVSSSCFFTAKDAANALRAIADSIEKQEGNELFPKPMSRDDMRAWCEQHGIEFIEADGLDDQEAAVVAPVAAQTEDHPAEHQVADVGNAVVHRLPTARKARG